MKASAIYRKAARLIANGKNIRSCLAIEAAQGRLYFGVNPKSPAHDEYKDLILGGVDRTSTLFPDYSQREADEVRVLALLLMAEIAADAERPMTKEERRQAIVALAQQQQHVDGEVEVDDNAKLSDESDDNGIYVHAYVWVRFDGTKFDKGIA